MKTKEKSMIHYEIIENGLTTKQMSDFEMSSTVGGLQPCLIDRVCGAHACGVQGDPCGVQGCVADKPCGANACGGKIDN